MFSWARRTHRIFYVFIAGVFLQYLVVYTVWNYFCQCDGQSGPVYATSVRQVPGTFTCVFADVDAQFTDLPAVVGALEKHSEIKRIITVTDAKIYPPVKLDSNKHTFVELEPSISPSNSRVEISRLFSTEWVLVLPDFLSFVPDQLNLRAFIREADSAPPSIKIFLIKIRGKRLSCHSVLYAHADWTLSMNSTSGPDCDGVTGTAVYLLKTDHFLSLVEPFAQPVDESLLIQGSVKGWKMKILSEETPFSRSARLLEPAILTRTRELREIQQQKLYARMGVKRTVVNGHEEMYGCSRTTARCFGDVINEMPSYIYEKRHTPPCCVRALKKTLEHVVEVFNHNGVRYWLEGGSLLGAARDGQLIPWDYDVDLGMYLNDTTMVQYLQAAVQGPVVDPEGFVWEQSQPHEGHFFRVQYSQTNRMHVDIFPFYPNNSIMTKDYWFASHPQDREFPEHFLLPMDNVSFMGVIVPAPNHIREFLELKFGVGCIEHPKYPHSYNEL